MNHPLGLYIHIPFCRQRCDFCAFYLELYRRSAAARFVSALVTEIRLYANHVPQDECPLQSVYFGGGTPTVLGASVLSQILAEIRRSFRLLPDCEITVEAHPATVSQRDFRLLADAGVTRISFGAESMDDGELVGIGRPGLASDTVTAVRQARDAGFKDINLDLMYGLPGQSIETWRQTLQSCLDLTPTHLSCYALTIEDNTRLARKIEQRRCSVLDENHQLVMDETAETMLNLAGYDRYEISNYARPGHACRHNLLYWTGGEYIGLGPSAQSFVNGARFGNIANLSAYIRDLDQERLPIVERATLTEEEQLRDAVVFGLRLLRGIPADRLHLHGANYGHAGTIEGLRDQGFIEANGANTRLTHKGRLYADHVGEKLY